MFSRQAIVETFNLLEPKSGSFLDNFALKYGIEDKAIGTSKKPSCC
jgi:hypothetical protein